MTIHVKKQLIDSIKGLSFDAINQIEEYHKTKGGASVTELMECWFDYMPHILFQLFDEQIINNDELKLFAEFHGYISSLSKKINVGKDQKKLNDEDVFKNDPNWAKLREKAKEIYAKFKEIDTVKE